MREGEDGREKEREGKGDESDGRGQKSDIMSEYEGKKQHEGGDINLQGKLRNE